jgi:hypothetical protein
MYSYSISLFQIIFHMLNEEQLRNNLETRTNWKGRCRYFDVIGLLLLHFTRETLCIPHPASKTAYNREKRYFERNSLLFLNLWRYLDVLGLLLLKFTRETLCIPHPASKTDHNPEDRDFDQNSLLFLNRWRYLDVLRLLMLNFTR